MNVYCPSAEGMIEYRQELSRLAVGSLPGREVVLMVTWIELFALLTLILAVVTTVFIVLNWTKHK